MTQKLKQYQKNFVYLFKGLTHFVSNLMTVEAIRKQLRALITRKNLKNQQNLITNLSVL